MKKIAFIGLVFAIASIALCIWVASFRASNAQTNSPEEQKLLEWDRNVSTEKLKRVKSEALGIQNSIVDLVKNHFPEYLIYSGRIGDPSTQGRGRRGQTNIQLTWRKRDTQISLVVTFLFNNEEAVKIHRESTDRISLGEFFPAPEFTGVHGILVKNVNFNKKMSEVGIHFVKGRLDVSVYLENYKRKTEKNEKELIEFVRAIEPLIVAKPDIKDL